MQSISIKLKFQEVKAIFCKLQVKSCFAVSPALTLHFLRVEHCTEVLILSLQMKLESDQEESSH